MKYYIYISDAKVDMLYAQIPSSVRDKIAAELKIDLKVVSASFSEKAIEETRYSKLELVVEYIENHLEVGTVDNPKEYFKGSLPMRWGPFNRRNGKMTESGIVYFGGYTARTVVGLAGSMKHVIGANLGSSHISNSYLPAILTAIAQDLDQPFNDDKNDLETQTMLNLLDWHTRIMDGPPEKLQFLARKLLRGRGKHLDARKKFAQYEPMSGRGSHLLLGTPLYVAYE